jgi:hypothetical protein
VGTRIEVYLSHDLPRFDDAAAVLARLEATMPAALAVRDYRRAADMGGYDNERWGVEPVGTRLPNIRKFAGPGLLWLTLTPAAARVHTSARWRNFLSIDSLRRVHVGAFRAIASALGSAEMAVCADAEDDAADVFFGNGTQAECVERLRATLGSPQPSIELIAPEVVAEAERAVPRVWYLDRDHVSPAR